MNYSQNKIEINQEGYSILDNLYSKLEIDQVLKCLGTADQIDGSFIKTKDLFAIRQLLRNVPELKELLFNDKLHSLISQFYSRPFFVSKAIYFDKPRDSNWFVPFHQDLSISVTKKIALEDYKNWTFKKEQYGVQPPIKILQDTLTIRIHLDDTDENNGALKVIPGSHSNGIIRNDSKEWNIEHEHSCNVKAGGVMIMKPLTLHASSRTTNGKKRRVIHLEFNDTNLPKSLEWLERADFT